MIQRTLFLLLFVVFGSVATAADGKPHLLSVITSGSNDSQAMALILTRNYIQSGGSAQILLCDTAAELALQESDTGTGVVQPADASPRQMLGGLIEAGIQVEVCAIFLPNRSEDESDLRQGVGVARPGAIATIMGQQNSRLFTN